MTDRNRRLVYSTEPEPEPAPQPHPKLPPPRQQQVRVGLERKGRGGKSVSVITGVTAAPAELESLCKTLKNRLGAGGAVKGGIIEIQGDQRDKIVAILQEMGYQAKKAGG
ncbi:translation initiation factor [Caldilinea sp.]|jgi:translation initiation factor 1|uniref:translation initiation factor n=1 Tax=Caldilinea sp. TaxID=2293560 RepID=UPI001B2011B2|nr:translation initiation factor [Caldilinea sp.]MBO9394454.1 translation initiation factor [Caldilinea sp.]